MTERQREILALIACGITDNGELAVVLGMSRQTLNNHLNAIYDQLGLRRRCKITAVVAAVRTGQICL